MTQESSVMYPISPYRTASPSKTLWRTTMMTREIAENTANTTKNSSFEFEMEGRREERHPRAGRRRVPLVKSCRGERQGEWRVDGG